MTKTYSNETTKQKAVMCYACLSTKEDVEMKMSELKSLIKANDIDVVGMIVQNIKKPDLSYLIGVGKLQELKEQVELTNADLVVFQNELSGSKINNLEQYLNVKVIDRTMLILDIFAQRATSREGKLQVELAQLKYSLPRLAGLKSSNNRYGGGVGMRGPGETKLELDRRKVENQILAKQKELNIVQENRELRRKQRLETNQKTVALVGYTNSGKSTLMNAITKSDVFVKDMLFATLDTTTRKVYINENLTILLSDTVGFVS
ncbi:MAG: GTPase HflX, partial [Christensenellales bacterium]